MHNNKKLEIIEYYPNGTTLVVVRMGGLYEHYCIFFDGKAIHNSIESGVVMVHLSEFANGGKIQPCHKITSENLQLACEKAISLIGSPYNLFSDNCEHFVNYVHGRGKKSMQIERAATAAGVVSLTYILNKDMPPAFRIFVGGVTGSLADSEDQVRGAIRGAAMGAGVVFLCWLFSQQ